MPLSLSCAQTSCHKEANDLFLLANAASQSIGRSNNPCVTAGKGSNEESWPSHLVPGAGVDHKAYLAPLSERFADPMAMCNSDLVTNDATNESAVRDYVCANIESFRQLHTQIWHEQGFYEAAKIWGAFDASFIILLRDGRNQELVGVLIADTNDTLITAAPKREPVVWSYATIRSCVATSPTHKNHLLRYFVVTCQLYDLCICTDDYYKEF